MATPDTVTDQRPALWTLGAVLLVYAGVFAPTLGSMVQTWWRSSTYTHALLILPLSLWLIWRRRDQLAATPVIPFWPALLPLLAFCSAWLAGRAADLQVLEQMAAVMILQSLILLTLGRHVFNALLFPLLYLIFMVPVGDELTPALQQVTAQITVYMLRLTDIPVFLNGLYIEIPSGRFEVAEACSGIRYLIASLALGTLYAHLVYGRMKKRVLFILASLLVPIIANGLRAYLIVMIAHLSNLEYAVGVDHLIYGWLFFGLVIGLMFWVGSLWADPAPDGTAQAGPARPSAPWNRQARAGFAGAAAVLITFLLGSGLSASTDPIPLGPHQFAFGDYRPAGPMTPPWKPDFIGADRIYHQTFNDRDEHSVSLFIADYQFERQNKELINQLNQFFDKDAWSLESQRRRTLDLNGRTLQVRELDLRNPGGQKRRLWLWYRANGQIATQPLLVKLYQALARFDETPALASAFALALDYEEADDAERRLHRFLQQAWPQFSTHYE